MRAIDATLTDADIDQLLALRAAKVRHAPVPGVPMDVALRLGTHGLVRSDARGGVEITDEGLRYLEGWFLFCQAVGCDGVLRHWNPPSPIHAGSDPRDPEYQHERIERRDRWTITCLKCAHRNVLRDSEAPTMRSHYVIVEVFPPRAATAA